MARYEIFAKALGIALKERIIAENDFWTTDDQVVEKMEKAHNSEIHRLLHILEKRSLENEPRSSAMLRTKFRYIDPEILVDGKLVRLTSLHPEYKKEVEKAQEAGKKGIPMIKI